MEVEQAQPRPAAPAQCPNCASTEILDVTTIADSAKVLLCERCNAAFHPAQRVAA